MISPQASVSYTKFLRQVKYELVVMSPQASVSYTRRWEASEA